MKRKRSATLTLLMSMAVFAMGLVPRAFADDALLLSKIQDLQKQMMDMRSSMQKTIDLQNEKIRALEKREPRIELAEPSGDFKKNLKASIGDADKWLKDLKFSGDFRLRYEAFDFTSGNPAETDPRNRFRFRLRYGFEKALQPDLKVGFYMASGSLTDPTSTNETFDGNFVAKDLNIDRAYAVYTPEWAQAGPIEKLEIGGGKFKNPFERGSSKLIWDRDVRPEGIYETIDVKLLDTEDLSVKGFATLGQFILDEDSSASAGADAELYAYQAGIESKIKGITEKPVKFKSAFSFYDYSDFAIRGNFGAFARGNPNSDFDATSLDAGNFDVVESYNELGLQVNGLPPLKFFFDWAKNLNEGAVDSSLGGKNDAWALGTKVGKAKKKGSWEAGYEYRWIEPNSVVGAFNDSDFGTGHADKRGSVFSAKYKLTDNLTLAGTAFFVNNISAGTILRDEEQRRFQLDLAWKF